MNREKTPCSEVYNPELRSIAQLNEDGTRGMALTKGWGYLL